VAGSPPKSNNHLLLSHICQSLQKLVTIRRQLFELSCWQRNQQRQQKQSSPWPVYQIRLVQLIV